MHAVALGQSVESPMTPDRGRFNKAVSLSLLWGAQFSSYFIRYSLSVAAPTLMALYNISPQTMGYILSGWQWSYAGSQLLIGPVLDRWGVWIVMGAGSALWGAATAALPFATTGVLVFSMLLLFGFGHSMLVPGTAASIARWFAPGERARAVAVAFSGNQVGLALGGTIAAFVLAQFGWQAVFYVAGGGGVLLAVLWLLFYPERRIGREPAGPSPAGAGLPSATWASLFLRRSTWGIALGQMGYLYAYYFFISWLPGYLVIERQMTALRSGILSTLPFWAGMIGTLGGGWLTDHLIRRGTGPMLARKCVIGTSLTLATVLVVAAAFTQASWLAVTLLTLCVGTLRLTSGPANSFPIQLAPAGLVGSLASIQNFCGNSAGLLAPIATGYIVGSTGSFVGALVAAGGMALFGAVSYVFLVGRGETEPLTPAVHPAPVHPAASQAN
jgi:sugar phosphate permease